MRDLKLTSPLTRGDDVTHLQEAINHWRTSHPGAGTPITVDGQFGQETLHATGITAYQLGLVHRDARHNVQRLIEHPELRTPSDRTRAKHRWEKQKKNGLGLGAVLKHAQSHIGVAEAPPGSNLGQPEPEGWQSNFGMRGVSWCGCFSGSMILDAGGHVTSRVAYCPYIEADAKAKQNGFDTWQTATSTESGIVGPGWLVLYDWTGNKSFPEHVGVVESVESDHITAVEGNTGGSNPSDGGMVARMQRSYGFVVGFARPRF